MTERTHNLSPEIIEHLQRQGYAIDPEPIGRITEAIQSTTTTIPVETTEAISTYDTLVLMNPEHGPEGIWPHRVGPGLLTVVRGFPSGWDVRTHPKGTTIHRLYIDYGPLIGAFA